MCKLHISFIDMQRQHSGINFERGISTKIYKEIVLYIYIYRELNIPLGRNKKTISLMALQHRFNNIRL